MPVYKSKQMTKDGRQYFYTYSYKDLTGKHKKYYSKYYLTKKEATKAEMVHRLSYGEKGKSSITFSEAAALYLNERKDKLKPQTYDKLEQRVRHITSTIGTIKVEEMNASQYTQFRDALTGKNLSPVYKNGIITVLKSIIKFTTLRYGIKNDIPNMFNPFRNANEPIKKMDFYSLDEFSLFIKQTNDIRYKALFTVLFCCGLRIGEANALTWKDIDFNNNILSINKTLTTKKTINGDYLVTSPKTKTSIRDLPMAERVSDLLQQLHQHYAQYKNYSPSWHVFGGLKAIPETTIQNQKNKMCDMAGLRHIRVHDFRHSCASLLINNGASITLVANYLGHSDISITLNTYSHMYKSKLNKLVDDLNEILKPKL